MSTIGEGSIETILTSLKIEGTYFVANYDPQEFYANVQQDIDDLQNAGMDVEVQYQPVKNGDRVYFTAFLIGRK